MDGVPVLALDPGCERVPLEVDDRYVMHSIHCMAGHASLAERKMSCLEYREAEWEQTRQHYCQDDYARTSKSAPMEELELVTHGCTSCNYWDLGVEGESLHFDELLTAGVDRLLPCSCRHVMGCVAEPEVALAGANVSRVVEIARGYLTRAGQSEAEGVGIPGNGTWPELGDRGVRGARSDAKKLEKGREISALHVLEEASV